MLQLTALVEVPANGHHQPPDLWVNQASGDFSPQPLSHLSLEIFPDITEQTQTVPAVAVSEFPTHRMGSRSLGHKGTLCLRALFGEH